MFKKLKDKIAEEVKQSPQRIQQIAQAAQAAVGATPLAGPVPEVSSSDQFFSITEEDTPQNSPMRAVTASGDTTNEPSGPATLKPTTVTTTTNGVSPQSLQPRQRRLSNSSMASDVSFRLPAYDSPAVYHLQSDIDCSASEFEDTASNAGGTQLDKISKEQLHSAYKKASDRYQKYRSRYTEIAARYRELERDNNKARSVLVETQDKALRRISELREQCALEQQAKAHLESALRLEMDDMQCVIKTLKSKLSTVGDAESKEDADSSLLVDLSTDEGASKVDGESLSDSVRLEYEEKIKSLEKVVELYKTQIADEQEKHEARNRDVQELEKKVQQLNENLNEAIEKIKGLQSREEENTILLAENKMVVHSELEAKDEEVKKLRAHLQQLEDLQKELEGENKTLKTNVSSLSSQVTELESVRHDKEAKLNELEAAKIKLMEEASRFESQLTSITTERDSLQNSIKEQAKQIDDLSSNTAADSKGKMECIERLETELLELKTQLKLKDQELEERSSHYNTMEKNHQKMTKEAQKQKESELANLNEQLRSLQESLAKMTDENQRLAEEVKMTKILNENSESEAIESLRATIERQQKEWDEKVKAKDEQIADLNKQLKEYQEKSEKLNSEWETLKQSIEHHDEEMATVKGRIETLRGEKKELEKTLEKEIRDKNELQAQVTNILQEITRLEADLITSKDVLVAAEEEKSQMAEEMMNLRNQIDQGKSSYDDQVRALEERLNEKTNIHKEQTDQNRHLQEKADQLEKIHSELKMNHEKEVSGLKAELEVLQSASSLAQGDQDKLKECLAENLQLLHEKERLEVALKTIEDQMEAKEKEKLCVLDTNTSLEAELKNAKRDIFVMRDQILGLQQQLETAKEQRAESDVNLHDFKEKMQEYEDRLKAAEEEKAKAVEQLDTIQRKLDEMEYRHKRAEEETLRCRSDLEEKLKEMENVKVENEYLDTHVKQLEKDLQTLRDDAVNRDALLRELKDKYNFAENEMSSLQEQKSKFDCLMADKNHELDQTNVQLVTVKQELEAIRVTHKTQLSNLAEEVKELKSEISAKQIIINDLNQDLSRQEKELGQAKVGQSKELEELQKTNEELKREMNDLRGKTSVHEEMQAKYEDLEKVNSELQLKIAELETRLADNVVQKSRMELEQSSKSGEVEELREENETLRLKFQNLEKTLNSKLAVLDEKHKDLIAENQSLKEQVEKGSKQVVEGWEAEKTELEQRLQKIIAEVQEVSNRNMFLEQKCENFLVLEQANERMKTANDKLSRQLDETLVTMHHNEGIAANTEFEYLKNIMFQYLSGSMNSNSSTLVKVISAVLKFTPQQTQVVLEKENHRHTLLGQINKML